MDASEKIKPNEFSIAYHKLKLLLGLHIFACKLLLETYTNLPKMWTLLLSCREARELCIFYLKTIALLIFIFHNLITHCKTHELGYGKGSYCKSDDDCDKSRFLDCVGAGGTCDCNKASWLTWVPEENSCMLMESYPCGRKANGPKCITNSSCIAGKCDCDAEFLRDGFGVCDLSYGKTCSLGKPEKCAKRYSLECTDLGGNRNSECRCRNEGVELVWNEEKNKCVSTAGGTCDLSDGKDDQLECIDNAICTKEGQTGYCRCKPGFSQTPNFTCELEFGETCSNSFDAPSCNSFEFLVCNEGRCGCQFYGQMKYDTVTKQCRVLVGESCHVENGNANERKPKCVADSYCKPRPHGAQRGDCTCDVGMQALADGTCSRYNKGHNFPCSTSIDCNKEKFLECVNDDIDGSRCDCPQSEMYFDGKDCRVRAGRSCTQNKLCANNSYCEGDWCVCREGYKIDSIGCIKESDILRNLTTSEIYREEVLKEENESSCNDFFHGSDEWTRCRNCKAKFDSHIWIQDESTGQCLAMVGTYCSRDADCVPNAICDTEVNICQCSSVAHTTKFKTCVIMSGNSKHHVECKEIHTLKSVRSHDVYDNAAKAQSCTTTGIFFVPIVAVILHLL